MIEDEYNIVPAYSNKYKYPIIIKANNTASFTFTMASLIPAARRALYNYTIAAPIEAVRIKIKAINYQITSASTLNTPTGISLSTSGFSTVNLTSGLSTVVALINRQGTTLLDCSLITPMDYVGFPNASYSTPLFTLSIVDLTTLSPIFTTDDIYYQIEVTEYIGN